VRKQNYGILLPQVDDLQEINVMLADRFEQWALGYMAEGELKGRQEGKKEGEMLALQKLLAKRFGAIPANITALIANASVQDIESWFDQAIDAQRLSDIFTDAL
jgi:predicted transposase YdaD